MCAPPPTSGALQTTQLNRLLPYTRPLIGKDIYSDFNLITFDTEKDRVKNSFSNLSQSERDWVENYAIEEARCSGMLFFVCLLFTCARGLFYDDYEPLGFEYFDEIENATIIDLSVNATTPYTEDRGEYRIFPSKILKFKKKSTF